MVISTLLVLGNFRPRYFFINNVNKYEGNHQLRFVTDLSTQNNKSHVNMEICVTVKFYDKSMFKKYNSEETVQFPQPVSNTIMRFEDDIYFSDGWDEFQCHSSQFEKHMAILNLKQQERYKNRHEYVY